MSYSTTNTTTRPSLSPPSNSIFHFEPTTSSLPLYESSYTTSGTGTSHSNSSNYYHNSDNSANAGRRSSFSNLLNDDSPPPPLTSSYETERINSPIRKSSKETTTTTTTTTAAGNLGVKLEDVIPTRGYFNEEVPITFNTNQLPLLPPLPNLISNTRRPRRSISSKPPIPRQLSPFSLSPPPPPPPTTKSSAASKPTQTLANSNRKISHSLIEKRRREKINTCLTHLRELVPQCKELEGEKKARARNRKRGRGGRGGDNYDDEDEGEGGQKLHKLQILIGTISYIEELEAKLASYNDTTTNHTNSNSLIGSQSFPDTTTGTTHTQTQNSTTTTTTTSNSNSTSENNSSSEEIISPPAAKIRGTPTFRPYYSTHSSNSNSISKHIHSSLVLEAEAGEEEEEEELEVDERDDERAGLLLLNFSTSPELRPVFF